MDWFSGDLHLFHKNIVVHRPEFSSMEEMNQTIISRINAVVLPKHKLYLLGDTVFGGKKRLPWVFEQIKCDNIFVIKGNHDRKAFKNFEHPKVKCVADFLEIKSFGQEITLCHYALKVWNKSHYGSWCLYGHSHGSLPDDPHSLSFDAGVDCHNFAPLSFLDVKNIMAKKQYRPVDRHSAEKSAVLPEHADSKRDLHPSS